MAGEDLVAVGLAVGPAGLPRPVGSGGGNAGGQAAEAEAVGGQFELAGPCSPVKVGQVTGACPVHGGGGPREGGSCGVEVRNQSAGLGDHQKPRILQQVVQPTNLRGVQREVSPRVIVPAQRVGGGVGLDDRAMGLGRVDQEVGVLLWVYEEVGEGLVVHAKRAVRDGAIQELPRGSRHVPDHCAGQWLIAQPTSHQPELFSGKALILGDGKRGKNGSEPCRPGAVIAPQLTPEEVAIDPGQASLGQRHPTGSRGVKPGQHIDTTERLHDIEGV